MRSSTTHDFWTSYAALPSEIRARARVVYRLWMREPRHTSLRFKKTGDVWSIRIGSGYRALAVLQGGTYYWFWIGDHDAYDRLLGSR